MTIVRLNEQHFVMVFFYKILTISLLIDNEDGLFLHRLADNWNPEFSS